MEQKILDGEIGYDLTLSDLEGLTSFLINSPGGSLFEGLAMYDYVDGNDIEVGVIGVSASAATLPLIASSKRWGTPNSRYLIHNPWSMSVGDAEEMSKTAKDLKDEQQRALNLYVKHLNGTAEELQALMNEERIIDAEEALQLGLIKEIRPLNKESKKPEGSDINNLFTQFKMQYAMKEEDKNELSGLSAKVDELVSTIRNFFAPKMLVLQDVNGVEIDFGDAVETEEQVAVGVSATVDGSAAEGNYVLSDGRTLVFTGGELTAINEAEEEAEEDVEALKQKIADLEAANATLTDDVQNAITEKDTIQSSFDDVKSKFEVVVGEFDTFKNKFSAEKPEPNKPTETEDKESKSSFNKDKLRNQK